VTTIATTCRDLSAIDTSSYESRSALSLAATLADVSASGWDFGGHSRSRLPPERHSLTTQSKIGQHREGHRTRRKVGKQDQGTSPGNSSSCSANSLNPNSLG